MCAAKRARAQQILSNPHGRHCANRTCATDTPDESDGTATWHRIAVNTDVVLLCVDCHRAYEKGQYCPFCTQVWLESDEDKVDGEKWILCEGCEQHNRLGLPFREKWAHVTCVSRFNIDPKRFICATCDPAFLAQRRAPQFFVKEFEEVRGRSAQLLDHPAARTHDDMQKKKLEQTQMTSAAATATAITTASLSSPQKIEHPNHHPIQHPNHRANYHNNNNSTNVNVNVNNINVNVNILDVANRPMRDEEERVVGSVHYKVYKEYINAAGGIPAVVIVLTLFVLFQSSTVGANLWLSYWTQDNNQFSNQVNSVIYSLLIMASIFFSLLLAVYMVLSAGKAAKRLHDKLISSIINAPMKFFDSVPVGWIINRFSQDQSTIDDNLGGTLHTFITNIFAVGGAVCIICTATPFFLLFFIPLSLFYWWEQKYFIRTSRELKRLDGISRSPIYHHHCDSRNGTVTIRAYHREEHFMRLNENILNENQKIFFITNCAHRWIGIRLETVAAVVIAVASLLAVWSKGMVSAGLAGLSISYSLTVTQLLSALVRSSSDRESQIVHVERQKQYAEIESEFNQTHAQIPQHQHPQINNMDNKNKINNINTKEGMDINEINNDVTEVPVGWPNKGSISIRQLTLQYADSIKPVLNRVSVEIAPKQKIGICGRTGAGKSSLIATLFRIYEPTDGSIFIDDIDISQVRLELLRSRLTIITQNPVLFSGTLRYNLDPENKHSDSEIWEALDHVGLKDAILSTNQQLYAPVLERGMNWSQGERQLLCIARASLRSSSIVIFDEATAYMDIETDNKIQLLLMSLFADCTVLTVAHRLNSIMNYDLILVLENGKVVEFNSPNNLMANPDSTFRNMVNEIRKVKTVTKRRSFAASFVRNIHESDLE
eukprot:GILK01011444.1.p1 GENE.GILK01011444.1~~GILK01011444.1.p1  ORF type:complete len:917 (-),score=147.12 GILK01011444.1:177-2837(-)